MNLNEHLNHIVVALDLMKLVDRRRAYICWFRGHLFFSNEPLMHPGIVSLFMLTSTHAEKGLTSEEWSTIEGKIRQLILKGDDI